MLKKALKNDIKYGSLVDFPIDEDGREEMIDIKCMNHDDIKKTLSAIQTHLQTKHKEISKNTLPITSSPNTNEDANEASLIDWQIRQIDRILKRSSSIYRDSECSFEIIKSNLEDENQKKSEAVAQSGGEEKCAASEEAAAQCAGKRQHKETLLFENRRAQQETPGGPLQSHFSISTEQSDDEHELDGEAAGRESEQRESGEDERDSRVTQWNANKFSQHYEIARDLKAAENHRDKSIRPIISENEEDDDVEDDIVEHDVEDEEKEEECELEMEMKAKQNEEEEEKAECRASRTEARRKPANHSETARDKMYITTSSCLLNAEENRECAPSLCAPSLCGHSSSARSAPSSVCAWLHSRVTQCVKLGCAAFLLAVLANLAVLALVLPLDVSVSSSRHHHLAEIDEWTRRFPGLRHVISVRRAASSFAV